MTPSGNRLAGKVTLVTGSSPFINGGIACGLAEEGAKLVCIDYRLDYAEACAKEIRDGGGEASVLRALGVKPDAVAGHSYGEVTALHAAGVHVTPALTLTAERLMAQLRPLAKVRP